MAETAHHWQALFLALASSTDNFLVGLGTGLAGKPLPSRVLVGISVVNATSTKISGSPGIEG